MRDLTRRDTLTWMAAAAGCAGAPAADRPDPILGTTKLGVRWPTLDPFLFCVHHDDAYPSGNTDFGPAASLEGRQIGRDFEAKDGWSMYHGRVVPGFPRHPHRGFETVTVVRRGLLDHADSLGAAARYGAGDVQWLTAGGGILHAEMFPLLASDQANPVELFQIWLNLPSEDKLAAPHFTMLWGDRIPKLAREGVEVTVVAGAFDGLIPASPPPRSYASRPEAEVAIWTIRLAAGSAWTLPAAGAGLNRMLYVFRGAAVSIDGTPVPGTHAATLRSDQPVRLEASDEVVECLLLQGRPIGEPVARHGPFVMNSREEIERAYADYRRTGFGGWPWTRDDPVHGRETRFARHADGRVERPS